MAVSGKVLLFLLGLAVRSAASPSEGAAAETSNLRGTVSEQEGRTETEADAALQEAAAFAAAQATAFTAAGSDGLQISTFFWNTHWQCSMGLQGSSSACKDAAAQRAVDLALGGGADIAVTIELVSNWVNPLTLADRGMDGWSQVNGVCSQGGGGDALALAFKPGWKVQKSGGGCLRTDGDTRAFAAARVVPPRTVRDCPELCVLGVHAPHTQITAGGNIVADVCGNVKEQCALAMGDWNVPAEGLAPLWAALIGGGQPHMINPNEQTCCFPEHAHFGIFDHLATSINGATSAGHYVHPYQVTGENPVQQHRPVTAKVTVPAA